MKNFDKLLLVLGSGSNTKFTIKRNDSYNTISCEADVGRSNSIVESCNVDFIFDSEKDGFLGIHLNIKQVSKGKDD